MAREHSFDSRMLLKILLDPNTYLTKMGNVRVNESDKLIRLDIEKVLQDNVLESALNPAYVSSDCVYNSVQWFNGLVKNDKSFNSLKRLFVYCTKMCLLDCLFFKTVKDTSTEPNYSIIRIVPTMSFHPETMHTKIKSITDFNGSVDDSLFIIEDIGCLKSIFEFLKVDDELWKYSVLGNVFTEFPTVVNLCKRTQVDDIITDSDSDIVIDYLMRVIYLMMRYDFHCVMSNNANTESYLKEVNQIGQI